ncbi:hypothetical protein OKW34_000665 [Paraburkholderia youngii]
MLTGRSVVLVGIKQELSSKRGFGGFAEKHKSIDFEDSRIAKFSGHNDKAGRIQRGA